jgi:hypothetical protein
MELIVLLCALSNANDCREQHHAIPPEIHAELPHECTRYLNEALPRVMEALPKRRISRWACKPVEKHEEAI